MPKLVFTSQRISVLRLEKEKLMRSEWKTNDKRTVSEVTRMYLENQLKFARVFASITTTGIVPGGWIYINCFNNQ